MKRAIIVMFVSILAIVSAAAAEDAIHVAYRHENFKTEGNVFSGHLLITVINMSGAAARDMAVYIPGPNNIIFDRQTIYVGNLADGQRVEVLHAFTMPVSLKPEGEIEARAAWTVEYTDPSGERQERSVMGQRIPSEERL